MPFSPSMRQISSGLPAVTTQMSSYGTPSRASQAMRRATALAANTGDEAA